MWYTNSADNLEYYYDGANVDDGCDIDMEDDLLQLLDDAKKHSEEEEEDTTNNNNVGRDRRRRRSWKKYLVSWCRKCSEEEEDANKRKRKRKRMGNYNEVQVLGSGGGGCCWGRVVVLGRALRNSRAVMEMNYYKYNDGTGTSGSPPPPYESLHRHHMMKLGVDGNGGLSSSSYYGPIYLVT